MTQINPNQISPDLIEQTAQIIADIFDYPLNDGHREIAEEILTAAIGLPVVDLEELDDTIEWLHGFMDGTIIGYKAAPLPIVARLSKAITALKSYRALFADGADK